MANLAQLKILEDLNAALLVDKPAGIAFSTVQKAVKRKFNLVHVGHGGSLDASASGLFVLLINDANKFVGDIMGADRSYEGTFRLGVKTSTGDMQGNIIEEKDFSAIDANAIAKVMPQFKGDIFQTEPRFCAVRREGSALYEIADTGEHKPFLSHVWKFNAALLPEKPGVVAFSLNAMKGLLVRALADGFGAELGCWAALESCRRTRIGKFKVEDAIAFDKLLDMDIRDFASCTIPLREVLQ